jgi:hypothetical protein
MSSYISLFKKTDTLNIRTQFEKVKSDFYENNGKFTLENYTLLNRLVYELVNLLLIEKGVYIYIFIYKCIFMYLFNRSIRIFTSIIEGNSIWDTKRLHKYV